MKIRTDFVTNSSSSSFITIHIGVEEIEGHDNLSIDIDVLIDKLIRAKEKGVKTVEVSAYEEFDG